MPKNIRNKAGMESMLFGTVGEVDSRPIRVQIGDSNPLFWQLRYLERYTGIKANNMIKRATERYCEEAIRKGGHDNG